MAAGRRAVVPSAAASGCERTELSCVQASESLHVQGMWDCEYGNNKRTPGGKQAVCEYPPSATFLVHII
mgnify:CR=1 FL=1